MSAFTSVILGTRSVTGIQRAQSVGSWIPAVLRTSRMTALEQVFTGVT